MAEFLSQITDALGSAPDATPQVQLTGEGAYRSYFKARIQLSSAISDLASMNS